MIPDTKARGGVAEELNVSAGSVDATLQRMRLRYRELVRVKLADTARGIG
jgi:DNA-directed RNA polymerase specialized sigma24 family protein